MTRKTKIIVLCVGLFAVFYMFSAINDISKITPESAQQTTQAQALKRQEINRQERERQKGIWRPSTTARLDDGSVLTFTNVTATSDWACGKRATGNMPLPGQSVPVVFYYDATGTELQTIRVPQAGNEAVYDTGSTCDCSNKATGKKPDCVLRKK